MTSGRVLSSAVRDFYDRVLADPTLAPYFDGLDLARLQRHQTDFLLIVLQLGPERDTSDAELGRRLARAHTGLDISGPEYDQIVEHLAQALEATGFAEVERRQVLTRVAALRGHVVGA